jgi:integrase
MAARCLQCRHDDVDTDAHVVPDSLSKTFSQEDTMPLTIKSIPQLPVGRHHDKDGLHLKITPTAGSWLLRYQRDGKEHWLGLGPLRDFNLEEARDRARKARQGLRDNIDPIQAKAEARIQRRLEDAKNVSFEDAARQYFDAMKAKWSNARSVAQFLNTLRDHVFPVFGSLPVGLIDTPIVLKALEPIWQTKRVTAMRVRSRIENVLDWAKLKELRSGENPARWEGHLALSLPGKPEAVHHKAMHYRELPAFLVSLRARQGQDARALEFLILCASRTSEVLGARWPEFDIKEKIWIVPAVRMKGKPGKRAEHRVPLSDRAIEILKSLPREKGNDFIFIGSESRNTTNIFSELLKKMQVADIATPHGFRATFKNWCSEMTSFADEISEHCLAHVVGSEARRSYATSDMIAKRRKLLAQWAAYTTSPVRRGDVVPIRKGA